MESNHSCPVIPSSSYSSFLYQISLSNVHLQILCLTLVFLSCIWESRMHISNDLCANHKVHIVHCTKDQWHMIQCSRAFSIWELCTSLNCVTLFPPFNPLHQLGILDTKLLYEDFYVSSNVKILWQISFCLHLRGAEHRLKNLTKTFTLASFETSTLASFET